MARLDHWPRVPAQGITSNLFSVHIRSLPLSGLVLSVVARNGTLVRLYDGFVK